MRLSDREQAVIVDAVHRRFTADATVSLFGSRVDDDRRGGDIDLFVTTSIGAAEANRARMLAITDIQMALGDQKIDMVVSPLVGESDLIMQEIRRAAQLIG